MVIAFHFRFRYFLRISHFSGEPLSDAFDYFLYAISPLSSLLAISFHYFRFFAFTSFFFSISSSLPAFRRFSIFAFAFLSLHCLIIFFTLRRGIYIFFRFQVDAYASIISDATAFIIFDIIFADAAFFFSCAPPLAISHFSYFIFAFRQTLRYFASHFFRFRHFSFSLRYCCHFRRFLRYFHFLIFIISPYIMIFSLFAIFFIFRFAAAIDDYIFISFRHLFSFRHSPARAIFFDILRLLLSFRFAAISLSPARRDFRFFAIYFRC